MKAVSGVVRGMVQGVGFRYFTRGIAQDLGINGWVMNAGDGSVEFFAQADPAALSAFIGKITAGPSFSDVESIETHEAVEDPAIHSFEIKYY